MKFKTLDKKYMAQRKTLSKKYGMRELWSTIDHWPLYCGTSNLARFLSIAKIFEQTLPVPGHIAEFGSWRGANLMFMAKLLRIYDAMGSKMVHCFDSFEGLNQFHSKDGSARRNAGRYKGSLEELKDFIRLYDLTDDIAIHKGYVENTLKALLEKDTGLSFSLVYCDTDLYDSTIAILNQLHPRLSKGGVFVLDEWNYETYPGESKAVEEFMREYGDSYAMEHIAGTRQPSLLLRKIKY